MPKPTEPRATAAQVRFMEILFTDIGMSQKAQRLSWLECRGHRVKYLDELTKPTASGVIEELKEQRDRAAELRKASYRKEEDEDE